nr:DUF3263 domain-containing protein [Micromonospora sp. DSM 115978]
MPPPAATPAADPGPPGGPLAGLPAGRASGRRSGTRAAPAQRTNPDPLTDPDGLVDPDGLTEPDGLVDPDHLTDPDDLVDSDLPERPAHPVRSSVTDHAAGPAGPGRVRPDPGRAELTDRETAILAFERQWWKHAGAKEQAIRDIFDLSATRYYQLLNALLDNPAAAEADAMLVSRLRRLRAARSRSRRR